MTKNIFAYFVYISNQPMCGNQKTTGAVTIPTYEIPHARGNGFFQVLKAYDKSLVIDDKDISETTFIDRAT